MKTYGTTDPFRIAKALGICVFFYPLGKAAGMYKYLEHTKCIFINSDIGDEKFIRVVMAHELGHAVLHWKENCCFMAHKTLLLTSRVELDANKYAAHLLISEEALREYTDCTVEQIADCIGVSKELVELKYVLTAAAFNIISQTKGE